MIPCNLSHDLEALDRLQGEFILASSLKSIPLQVNKVKNVPKYIYVPFYFMDPTAFSPAIRPELTAKPKALAESSLQ